MPWYLPERNPLIYDEMRRRLRGGNLYAAVFFYLLVLSGVLVAAVLMQWPASGSMQELARFGRNLFSGMAIAQAVLVAVISPALTAGAITTEREKGTLDFIVIAPLSAWSIVTGKFWGAIAALLLLVFASLPITSILLTMGGISYWEVLLANVLTMMVGAYFAAMGLLASCSARQTGQAIFLAYLFALIGMPLAFCALLLPVATLLVLLICSSKVTNMRRPEGLFESRAEYMMQRYLLAERPAYPPSPTMNDYGMTVRKENEK